VRSEKAAQSDKRCKQWSLRNRLGLVRKDRAFLSGSLTKLIESFALYISLAGLIGHIIGT